jgi:sugar lactone lactonase YvrE
MPRVKAVLVSLLVASLAVPCVAALHTFGRRLATGPGDLLVLTDPDRDRVAIFDVGGDAPRKRAEFGSSGERPGLLRAPHGGAFFGHGELLVADSFNQRLQAYDLAALLEGRGPRLVRAWGAFGHGPAQLDTPVSGLAVLPGRDGDDLLFVADTRNHRVQAFDRLGRSAGRTLGGRGASPGRLDSPAGLAVDPARSLLYVAEQGNRRVSVFDARSGSFLFTFGPGSAPPELQVPVDVAVDSGGGIWVVDQAARRVVRFALVLDRAGVPRGARRVGSFGRVGVGPGAWQYPQAIALDARHRVYVADRLGGRCQFFSEDGEFLGSFGADLGAGGPEDRGAPPGGPSPGTAEACSNGGTYGVRVRSTPDPLPLNEYFSLEVEVRRGCGSDGAPAADVGLVVDAWMPEHGHGMTTLPQVSREAGGGFRVSGLLFHMPGRWEL